jgi:hypothetical protein
MTMSVQLKKGAKVSRSSKVFIVKAKKASYLEPKLSGTPEEQIRQVLPALNKIDAIKGYGPWVKALYKLETSVVPYGMTVWADPGTGIFKISVGGLTSCFRSEYVNANLNDDEALFPYSCSKDCLDYDLKEKNPFPFYECRLFPQLQLTGTPQEKAKQLVVALEKVAAISDFKMWHDSLFELNRSITSYYLYADSPVNSLTDIDKGKNRDWYFITQWNQTGQSSRVCFLWTNVSGSVDQKFLKPSSC